MEVYASFLHGVTISVCQLLRSYTSHFEDTLGGSTTLDPFEKEKETEGEGATALQMQLLANAVTLREISTLGGEDTNIHSLCNQLKVSTCRGHCAEGCISSGDYNK